MTVKKKHVIANVCVCFRVLDFETRIKTTSPLINCSFSEAMLIFATFQPDAISAHGHTSLVSHKHVHARRFQSVSPGFVALVWFSCCQGWKWTVFITVLDVLLLKQLGILPDICQAAGDFCFARALNCCDTRLRTSHHADMWPLSSWPQSCRLQDWDNHSWMCLWETARDVKHRRSAVVINRMTYNISQGRVETSIRRGGKFCCSFVANLFGICMPKIIQIWCGLTKLLKLTEIKRVQLFCHGVEQSSGHSSKFTWP